MDKTKLEEQLRVEYGKSTKAGLISMLEDEGINPSSKEKKEDLLKALIDLKIAKREVEAAREMPPEEKNSVSEAKKDKNQAEGGKKKKKPSKTKKQAKSGKTTRTPIDKELVKEKREKRDEIFQTAESAASNEEVQLKASGNDAVYRPKDIEEGEAVRPSRKKPRKPKILEEDIELSESLNNPAVILTGEHLYSIENRDKKKRFAMKKHPVTGEMIECYEIAAVIRYGSRLVFIPAENYLENYFDMNQQNVGTYIKERAFAEVDFRVIAVNNKDKDNPMYIGSRVAAMKKLRCDFWYSGRQKARELLTPGTIETARVVAVTKGDLYLELYGVETRLGQKAISYTYIDNMKEEYTPGDEVEVMIKSAVTVDAARAENLGFPVKCNLSIKEAKPDPREKYFMTDMTDVPFRGIVRNISINDKNVTWYYVEMGSGRKKPGDEEGITIMCRLGKNCAKIPRKGDIASGDITFVNHEEKLLYGAIFHVDPPLRRNR